MFFELPMNVKLMCIEAFVYLGWARVLKVKPFSKVVPILGQHMEETTTVEPDDQTRQTLSRVSEIIELVSRYTFWESQCLVRAIAAMKMLEKRGIESTLYLGTAKDETGKLIAHAWLRSGPYYISGMKGMERFTVVSKFAKRLNSHSVQGEKYG